MAPASGRMTWVYCIYAMMSVSGTITVSTSQTGGSDASERYSSLFAGRKKVLPAAISAAPSAHQCADAVKFIGKANSEGSHISIPNPKHRPIHSRTIRPYRFSSRSEITTPHASNAARYTYPIISIHILRKTQLHSALRLPSHTPKGFPSGKR